VRLGHKCSSVDSAASDSHGMVQDTESTGLEVYLDMAKSSEVEIQFTAEAPDDPRRRLEHKLERHGEGYEQLRAMFDRTGRLGDILALYAPKRQMENAITVKPALSFASQRSYDVHSRGCCTP